MKEIAIIYCLSGFLLHAEGLDHLYKTITNTMLRLPAGVPRTVTTNGEIINVDFGFTTREYQRETFKLILQEANRVADDLGLAESRPITESNIVHAFISPFGFAYLEKALGNITTSNYWYNCRQHYKFSELTVAHYDDYFVRYQDKKYHVPVSQLNTNAAYQLAARWLKALRMDVEGLNRDCELRISLSSDMLPEFAESVEAKTRKTISPVYWVSWRPKKRNEDSVGSTASVELYLPSKQLLQLSVNDPKYILRPPLVFTNLEALFPGKGEITTNYPSEPIIIDGSTFSTDETPPTPQNNQP